MLKILVDKENNFFEWRQKDGAFLEKSILLEEISKELLSSLAIENSLFGGNNSYHFWVDEDSFLSFFNDDGFLKILKESNNYFVFVLSNSSLKTKKNLEKNKIEYYEILAVNDLQKKPAINVFILTDYLLSRDKKNFWLSLNNLKEKGVVVESIMPIIWWQIKIMKSIVLSGEGSGHKTFVFNKTKNGLKNFTKEEVLNMAREFLIIFNEKRFISSVDNFLLLERFVFKYL